MCDCEDFDDIRAVKPVKNWARYKRGAITMFMKIAAGLDEAEWKKLIRDVESARSLRAIYLPAIKEQLESTGRLLDLFFVKAK